jgi:glutamate-1-semialdehyde 2,1-aminomutase
LMDERDGFRVLRSQGLRFCRLLNEASTAAKVSELAKAEPCLEGTSINLTLHPSISADQAARVSLRAAFQRSGIMLLIGHPSFVTLAHAGVSDDWAYDAMLRAFRLWGDGLQ